MPSCPRCAGLMIPERDHHGEYSTCLCCGHQSYFEPPDYTPAKQTGRRKEERLRGRTKREPYRKESKERRSA